MGTTVILSANDPRENTSVWDSSKISFVAHCKLKDIQMEETTRQMGIESSQQLVSLTGER